MCEKEWFELCKKIRTERVIADGVVSNTPSLIYSLTITSDSGGAGTATVYDGSSPKADQKVDISTIDDDTRHHNYFPPMYFRRGIYVDLGSNITSVVVRYQDVRE